MEIVFLIINSSSFPKLADVGFLSSNNYYYYFIIMMEELNAGCHTWNLVDRMETDRL